MDIHSRLVSNAITGLLGGHYDDEKKTLFIDIAVPCDCNSITIDVS